MTAMRERLMEFVGSAPLVKQQNLFESQVFFSKSRLSLKKWLLIIYWWAKQYPVTNCRDEADVDQCTAVDTYQWLREVCSTRLLRDPPIVLGGQGVIVQVDESLFRHKPKVFNPIKHKYSYCSITVEGQQHQKCGYLAL